MAGRPPKEGLDYSEWDLWVLDNDKKIDALIEAQGALAFVVYFYLTQHAYAEHGYYLEWDYDSCPSTARRLGRGVSAEFVRNCVEKCLQVGLYDKGLFETHGVLTSEGIQKRYWKVAKNRTSRGEARKYWLLDASFQNEEDPEGLVSHTPKPNYEPPKFNYEPPKCAESRVEQRRDITLSLARPRGKHQNVMLSDEQYADIKAKIPDADAYIDGFSAKLHDKGYTYSDHYATLLSWWASDQKRKRKSGSRKKASAGGGSFDTNEFFTRAVEHGPRNLKGEDHGSQ